MADIIVLLVRAVHKICEIAEEIEETDKQACRLVERLKAVEAPVGAVKVREKLRSAESLKQLLKTLEESYTFLAMYKQTSKTQRTLQRKTNTGTFARLGDTLTQCMDALQLNISVDAWAKEDEVDRMEDLERIMGWMEDMKRTREGDQQEIVCLLQVNICWAP